MLISRSQNAIIAKMMDAISAATGHLIRLLLISLETDERPSELDNYSHDEVMYHMGPLVRQNNAWFSAAA